MEISNTAMDFAKYFIKRGFDSQRNTYDGNMKLQKLLFFANFISLLQKRKLLFSDPILAFSNGCVVEDVRLRYKNDFACLCEESAVFEPRFSQDEYDVLTMTTDLFGNKPAKELSELNHQFSFWKNALQRSADINGFKNKDQAIVLPEDMVAEAEKMQAIIAAYLANKTERAFSEVINGVTFYYDPEIEMSDSIIEELESFSKSAEDDTYSVYKDNGKLVIF